MADEHDERRRHRHGIQSQTDRDLAAIERRRAASHHDTDQDAIAGEFESSTPPEIKDEITKPHEVAVIRKYESDPAFRALWDRLGEFKAEVRHTQGIIADQTMATHATAAASVNAGIAVRVDEMEEWMHKQDVFTRGIKWIGGLLIATCLTSIIVVGTKIFNWGVSDGESAVRMERMEHDIQTIQQHLTEALRITSPQQPPWLQQLLQQQKGTQP